MKEFVVETFVFECTVVNNALAAFVFLYCLIYFLNYRDVCFLSVSLASALWNSLGRIAIHPHLIVTLFFIFFLLKIRIALNKSSGTKTMKTEHFTGRHGCKKPHTAPVSTLKIHCFSFVNVLLLCIVHSSKKQQCYVTSCCISGPSMDISCDVKIISGAQALCSTF